MAFSDLRKPRQTAWDLLCFESIVQASHPIRHGKNRLRRLNLSAQN